MKSSNVFINYFLMLVDDDIIDSEHLLHQTNEELVGTNFHALIASICMSICNLKITSGDPAIDYEISSYRNILVHNEGSINKKLTTSLQDVSKLIITKFELDYSYSNYWFSNYCPKEV